MYLNAEIGEALPGPALPLAYPVSSEVNCNK